MATYQQRIRQGLPRTPGGAAWPDVEGAVLGVPSVEPVGSVAGTAGGVGENGAAAASSAPPAAAPVAAASATESVAETPEASSAQATPAAAESAAPVAAAAAAGGATESDITEEVALRRGLPRVAGGDPWPPEGTATVVRRASAAAATVGAPAASPSASTADTTPPAPALPTEVAAAPEAAVSAPVAAAPAATTAGATAAFGSVSEEVQLRQGLPRTVGGDPWPPAGSVTVERAVASLPETAAPAATAVAEPAVIDTATAAPAAPEGAAATESAEPAATTPAVAPPAVTATPAAAPASAAASTAPAAEPATPAPAAKPAKPAREPIMIGSRTLGKWVKLALLWGGGAIVAAGIIVLAARGVTTLPGVPEFMQRYPGEYHLPEFVDPGFPAWARWTHFLNFFLMILIIRSGLLVRTQQRPDAYFTPKKGGTKVSIYVWLHTSLDVLWLLNGLVFVVLLFATGHWARIVPTSWEVFPNAISAGLQYLTLEWPLEDGWVNYNSLQQLMYFTVVFVAAPLAAITGVRMSEWWPKNAEKLNKLYPAPIARAVHFPVMLFFVLFIIVHVFLVFTTGALKNLNHMFAGTPEISWVGFWWFAAAVLVTAAVTWAARPLVLAPIANLFGRVSER